MHFAVLARVKNPQEKSLAKAVSELLAPYESDTDDPKYLEFEDEEDETREEYETGAAPGALLADGSYAFAFDPRVSKEKLVTSPVPFKTLYSSFDIFCKEWHGVTRDPVKGRVGRWSNPNARWDWYVIGGRWEGFFEQLDGTRQSWMRYEDLRSPHIQRIAERTAEQHYNLIDRYISTEGKIDMHEKLALNMSARERGTARTVMTTARPAVTDEEVVVPFAFLTGKADAGWEIWPRLSKEAFIERYADRFHPLYAYAFVDETGWYDLGMDAAFKEDEKHISPGTLIPAFVKRVYADAADDDVLVLVDIHN